tara:strand:- start:3 stop:422 length:420 start_codon:yes stop_codon:yes gene_type:complete
MGIILSKVWNNDINIEGLNKIVVLEINDGKLNMDKLGKNDLEILYKCLKNEKIEELESLDYAINNLNTKLIANKNDIKTNLVNLENNIKGKYECSICFENPKQIMFIPCGHSFCRECSLKFVDECCICRQRIEKRQNIY